MNNRTNKILEIFKNKKFYLRFFLATLCFLWLFLGCPGFFGFPFGIQEVLADTHTSTATGGTWATAGTWDSGVAPVTTDDVIIATTGGSAVNIGASTTIVNVTINSGAILTHTSNKTLGVSGNYTNNGTHTNGTAAFTLSGSGATIDGSGSEGGTGAFTLSTAKTINATCNLTVAPTIAITTAVTITNNGTITANNTTNAITGVSGTVWVNAANSTLNAAGPVLTTGTLTASANPNTVDYKGGAQIVKVTTYHHLTLSGSGAKTMTSVTTVNGNFSMSGSGTTTTVLTTVGGNFNVSNTAALTLGNATLVVSGNVSVSGGTLTTTTYAFTVNGTTEISGGTLSITGGTNNKTFIGLVTVNGGILSGTSTFAVFCGGITQTSGTVSITGTATFNTNNQALNGTIAIATLTVASGITVTNNNTLTTATLFTVTGALTNNGTVTASSTLTGGGTWTQGTNSTLNAAGASTNAMAVTTVDFTATGNTVNYNFAGAQTVKQTTYVNLTLSGTSAKTTTSVTVNGILSMEGTATASATITYGVAATLQYNTATARTVATTEWLATFAASGGVIIASTGTITLNAAKVFNASIPLTIQNGATLATGNLQLTFGGNFVINGTGAFTGGSAPIVIADTMTTQSIAGFTTTGLVSMTKTAGTATFTGNVNGGAFTLSGLDGTLDLGTGLTHTFTGAWTRTNGALLGNSSTLNIGGTTTNTAGTFTAGTSTVNYNGGAQTIASVTYNNLTLSTSDAKTMTSVTTVNNDFTMSGSATTSGMVVATIGGNVDLSGTAQATTGANLVVTGTVTIGSGTVFTTGANFTLSVTGTTSVTGTLALSNSGAKTLIGAVTINNTGAFTVGAGSVEFRNGLTNSSGGTITIAAAATFTTNDQAIAGANSITFSSTVGISTAAKTLTNNNTGTVTVTGTLTLTGNWTQGTTTNTLALGSTTPFAGAGTFSASGSNNTVNYNYAGDQTVKAVSYYNLTISDSGIKTFTASCTVTGTFTDTTPSSILTFADNGDYNFTNINISGSPGPNITMTWSSGVHGHWHFIVPGTPTVTYVTVDHSDATGSGAQIDATSNCTDGLNNTFWNFGVVLSITAPTSVTFGAKAFSFSGQNSTGNTLGTDGEPIQVTGSSAGWIVNATCPADWTGPTAMDYDGDGSTTGQLTINTSSATVTKVSGQDIDPVGGPKLGPTDSFSSSTSTITIGLSNSGYGAGTYDFKYYDLQQFIPGAQPTGTYTTTLTLDLT